MGEAEAGTTFDAVRLGILWDRLVSISDEIVETLVRTSFSTIVREGYDLTVVLFDSSGRSLCQGTRSIPVFMGSAPFTLRYMLEKLPPERLSPGDVVITNDPYHGTGHMFDISVMRPVYRNGTLVGYVMTITHLPDIGGMGFSATATEMYHEGLRIPVCRLIRAGTLNTELLDLIRDNVRVPEQVIGDIMANVNGCEVGAQALVDFMAEYQVADLLPLGHAIRAQSEAAARREIARIPDGVYRNRVEVEAVSEPITLVCTIEKKDDGIVVDFTGSSGAVLAGINVPFCYTRAMVLYSMKCLTSPDIPNNEGSVAPVTLIAPAGSILNARPPAATAGRHAVGHYITPLIFGALAAAIPHRVQADSGMLNFITVQGALPDGTPSTALYMAAGGFGALAGLDGQSTTPGPSNMAVVPVEIWESRTGITIESKRLLPDSGGAGEYRGGLGQEIIMRNDTGHPLAVFGMANRTDFPAQGLHGGQPGARREHRVNGRPVHPKGRQDLAPGDRLTLIEAGGGGFGDPRRRSGAALEKDLADGFISPEAAVRDYGQH